ncbi:MAG TPA: hypothetical protein VK465_17515, partial [Fibrobacteria bacterium]|nr:hypothetical protein [Fibrobacteria bacterium]
DSLWITIPGMYPQRADALDSSTLISRASELRVSLIPDAQGCPGAWVEQGPARTFAPAYDCSARPAGERFPGLPDTLSDTVSTEGGSARDLDPTLDGKPRFAGDGDSLFLRGGDGWVAALGTSHPGGYALAHGGDYVLLRVPALEAGAVKVILHLRPERGSGRRRARFSIRAGNAAERQDEDLGGQVWVAFTDKPVELVLGPFPARKEPWYLRVERVPTADAPFAIGLAGYVATTD